MVTCGGQDTIPIVAAVARAAPVRYAEIVASIASKSAGPATRANIHELTETTSRPIESVGGAARGKAIMVPQTAQPAPHIRHTASRLCHGGEQVGKSGLAVRSWAVRGIN